MARAARSGARRRLGSYRRWVGLAVPVEGTRRRRSRKAVWDPSDNTIVLTVWCVVVMTKNPDVENSVAEREAERAAGAGSKRKVPQAFIILHKFVCS